MTETARLHPDDIEAIAESVTERMIDALADGGNELTLPRKSVREDRAFSASARDIASRCNLSADWVRRNAAALGGVRIGNGNRPRHRFNVAVTDERIATMRADIERLRAQPAKPPRQRRQRRASQPDRPLLPIKGRSRT